MSRSKAKKSDVNTANVKKALALINGERSNAVEKSKEWMALDRASEWLEKLLGSR